MTASVQYLQSLAIGDDLLAQLAKLDFSSTRTRRICLHRGPEAPLHAMLVESEQGSEYPPHAHHDSDEIIVVVKGRLEVTVWPSEADKPKLTMVLAAGETAAFIPRDTIHKTKPYGGPCICLEAKLGPFNKDATRVFA